jgi:hypothetical protein
VGNLIELTTFIQEDDFLEERDDHGDPHGDDDEEDEDNQDDSSSDEEHDREGRTASGVK